MFKVKNFKSLNFYIVLVLCVICTSVNAEEKDDTLLLSASVKHDTSPPLMELLYQYDQLKANGVIDPPIPDYVIPNILQIPPGPAEIEFNKIKDKSNSASRGGDATNGLESPPVQISVDGYTAGDNNALFGGSAMPPDTNGDVGINYYVQYVNSGWLVLNKNDGSRAAGPFRGNLFWAGFGGRCQNNNAGDPIVLYDKQADRWVFSQFVNSNSTAGIQCFAISTTNDPLGSYHRYQFLFPGEFNDYPHIGIWDDVSGERSGYYFVTHDFGNNGFNQASFAVVERSKMLEGNPAQFIRFTDTFFNGSNSFGALPAHLESKELSPLGMCNPFVMARPDLNGYQLVDLCVDWNNAANSFLSEPLIIDAGENWNFGPTTVAQPDVDVRLDTLSFFGRIMYRASFRAYPDEVDLKNTMVISFPVNLGGGHAGIRWAQINFPENPRHADFIFANDFEGTVVVPDPYTVANQGEYGPDATDRWMSGISIDKAGGIGLAYTVANSDEGIFPGVRFTTRAHGDDANTLREEQICVDGGGAQTGGSRWGDYSSVSVDPVDECTFWASVEYQLTTSQVNWSNRVCSFKMLGCEGPTFNLTSNDTTQQVCTAEGSGIVNATIDVDSIVNFSNDVSLVFNPALPVGMTSVFTPNPVIPGGGADLALTVLNTVPNGQYTVTVEGSALDTINRTLDFDIDVANGLPGVTNLTAPANMAFAIATTNVDFSWDASSGAASYFIEISRDSGFTDIVESATVSTNSFQSTVVLNTSTIFYWRVTALNYCGASANSSTFEFTTGSLVTGTAAECPMGTSANVVFYDDIEGDVSDWTLPVAPIGTNTWVQSSARAFAGMSWFAEDLPVSSDQYLVSPAITLPSITESPISLSYWNFQDFEANTGEGTAACWDGGVLEISTDGGSNFTQISSNELLGDPYNGTIFVQEENPLSGRNAWCASSLVPESGEQTDVSVVNLNAYAGQTVQFRFRVGTDGLEGTEGWYLDDLTVQGCQSMN